MNPLDNPIWNALITEHAHLAIGDELARRYPPDIGPLAGIKDASAAAYAALASAAGASIVVLFSVEPISPPGSDWKILREGPIVQMLRTERVPLEARIREPRNAASSDSERPCLRRLTPADAPAMVALAELTEPGPFRLRTIELGNFYGIFHSAQLVAMAGRRMHLPGLVEVSGVCTHPGARGRGYARTLMSVVIDELQSEGNTAFLHAFAENPAIRLYRQMGFSLRQQFHFAVLAPDASGKP